LRRIRSCNEPRRGPPSAGGWSDAGRYCNLFLRRFVFLPQSTRAISLAFLRPSPPFTAGGLAHNISHGRVIYSWAIRKVWGQTRDFARPTCRKRFRLRLGGYQAIMCGIFGAFTVGELGCANKIELKENVRRTAQRKPRHFRATEDDGRGARASEEGGRKERARDSTGGGSIRA
jgi:hypothetical protein